jgi:hypothetical protein
MAHRSENWCVITRRYKEKGIARTVVGASCDASTFQQSRTGDDGAHRIGRGAGRGRAQRAERGRRRGDGPGPRRPLGDRQPVDPERHHQLEHV